MKQAKFNQIVLELNKADAIPLSPETVLNAKFLDLSGLHHRQLNFM
jgi:hypothetical protein